MFEKQPKLTENSDFEITLKSDWRYCSPISLPCWPGRRHTPPQETFSTFWSGNPCRKRQKQIEIRVSVRFQASKDVRESRDIWQCKPESCNLLWRNIHTHRWQVCLPWIVSHQRLQWRYGCKRAHWCSWRRLWKPSGLSVFVSKDKPRCKENRLYRTYSLDPAIWLWMLELDRKTL